MSVMNMREGDDPKFQFVNVVPPQSVYGGVRLDARVIADLCVESVAPGQDPFAPAALPFAGFPFVVDLPLSAIADTMTLPTTIRATMNRPSGSSPPARDSPPVSDSEGRGECWAGLGYWAEYYRNTHPATQQPPAQ
jgi:hypothetical protein